MHVDERSIACNDRSGRPAAAPPPVGTLDSEAPLELRHLRYFVAVAEELHFGRAAERLHVAQSSLSTQVRALERNVGAQLLERTSRRVELTAAGRVLLDQARTVLASVEAAATDARRAAAGELGELVLAFVDSAAYALLPPVLRELHDRLPDVRVGLREVSVETDLDRLHHTVDLAVLRDVRAVEGMALRPLIVEDLVAAVPSDHALAQRDRLPLSALAGVGLVLPHHDLAPNVHDHLRAVFATAGVRPQVTQQALQYPTVLGLVAAGYGVALVPAAITALAPAGVTYVPVTDEHATTTLVLASSAQRTRPVVERAAAIAVEVTTG
jgi:DNA-binding transcriptional LysR family regulator